MTKRYLKDWAYSKIIDYQLNSKAFGSMALSERRSCARRFEVLPASSVVALCILNLCEKIAKKMLTELSDYVNIFLACDVHVQCASGSVVEHLLAKEGAAGSIPVSRFFFTFLGVFCVCTYIWKILKLKHFPKKLIPYIKIRY